MRSPVNLLVCLQSFVLASKWRFSFTSVVLFPFWRFWLRVLWPCVAKKGERIWNAGCCVVCTQCQQMAGCKSVTLAPRWELDAGPLVYKGLFMASHEEHTKLPLNITEQNKKWLWNFQKYLQLVYIKQGHL